MWRTSSKHVRDMFTLDVMKPSREGTRMPDAARRRTSQVASGNIVPAPRTITVAARSHSRFARLRLRRPTAARPWSSRFNVAHPDRTAYSVYDAPLARELLARTAELPASKRALIVMLTEYRHALSDLAATPSDTPSPST